MPDYTNPYWQSGSSVPQYEDNGLLDNPLINNFATRGLLSGVQWLGETLGKPQAALFGAAKGDFAQLANLIPFSDTLGITNTGDPNKGLTSERVGGRDLLRHYGMVDQEDNYGNFAGGLALDLLADPLAFVRGPLGALTKAGEAAQKAGKLGRTISKRMTAATPEGGLFSITNKPWYAEMLGMGKPENVYVAGVDPFMKGPAQAVAKGMESGWNKATEAVVPGTNFSPLAWMRSALEPGAANISGHPKAVRTFGEHNTPRYNELVDAGAEAVGQTDILGKQANYFNKSSDLGTDSTKAAHLSSQMTHVYHELDRTDVPAWVRSASGVPTDQIDLAKSYAKEASDAANVITRTPREEALKVGYEVGDTSKSAWQHPYFPRGQAATGNKTGMHAHARDADFTLAPGGKAMIEEIMIGPASGAKHITGLDADAAMKAEVAYWTPHVQQEAMDRLNKIHPATSQNVPEELTKLTTPQGAAEWAAKMVSHAADLSPDVAKRGYYYRPDVGGELNSYAKNIAKPTAVASSAIQTLKEHAQDFTKMAGNNPTTYGNVRLDDAMKDIGIGTGKAELAKRMGVTEAELANYGVGDDLVQALKKEANPLPTREKSGWSKMVDAFRYGVTIPWPANLVRNWTSTLVDQGMAGTGATKGLAGASKIIRGAMTDPAEFSKWQPIMQKAIEHGVIGTDQVKALLGEGFDRAGNVAINVKPAQVEKTIFESLKDFAKPITSVEEGRKVGVEPLKELVAQSAMNPTLKKAAGILGNAIDPVRRYAGTMETAHHFQNEVTRLQQFANLIDDGYSPAAAAKRVKVNQRDYIEGSTPFVRDTLKNAIPFANFCMPPDHEILTRDGWKTYDQLTIGEEVMAYDISTEVLKWQPLLAVNVFDYDGEMLSMKRKGGLEFQFTPEHMWPVRVDDREVVRPYGTYRYSGYRAFVKGSDLGWDHSIPTAGNFVGDGQSILSPRHAAILGWVVTDGHHRWRRNHCEMVVYQHPKKFLTTIQDLLGTSSRQPHPDTGVVCTPVSNADVKEITNHFRSKSDLCKIVARLSREAAEAMWQAMFEAEGTTNFRNGRQQFSQNSEVNPDVLDAFQLLCLMTERNMAIRASEEKKEYTSIIDGREVTSTSGTSYYIKTVKWMRFQGSKAIHRGWYKGKIWCPTVKWGTWLVRRNGHVVITGNSLGNLKAQGDMLSRNTGRYSALMTLLNSGRGSGGFVPGYASSGAAIPLPGAEDGQQRFLGSLGLTQEDEMMSALASLAGFRGREAVRKFASGSNPALKVPFEIATGTQVFSGRKLDDLNPSSIATLLTLGQSPDAARMLSSVASGTPAARVFSTVDRLADMEKKGPIATLLNLSTGLRDVTVDTKAAAQIAARDQITKMLNATDAYKLREQLVVDPKWKESGQEMPPEIAELFRQYELLQQAGKAAVKERQAAGR